MNATRSTKRVIATLTCDLEKQVLDIGVIADAEGQSKSEALPVGQLPLADLRRLPAEEAEAKVGAAMLGVLDSFVAGDLGIRDYGQIANEGLEKAYTEIARRADENDPAAQFALAMSNIADSVRLRDSSLLERAEQWLKKSAGASYEEASGFLRSSWDDVKKTRLKMIAAAKEKDRRGR